MPWLPRGTGFHSHSVSFIRVVALVLLMRFNEDRNGPLSVCHKLQCLRDFQAIADNDHLKPIITVLNILSIDILYADLSRDIQSSFLPALLVFSFFKKCGQAEHHFLSAGYPVPYVFLKDNAVTLGHSIEASSHLLVYLSAVNTVGRVLAGKSRVTDLWTPTLWTDSTSPSHLPKYIHFYYHLA